MQFMKWSSMLLRAGSVLCFLGTVLAQSAGTDVSQIGAALRAHDFDRALQLVRPALQRSPNDARLWTLEGIALSEKGQKKEALSSFHSALKLAPDYLPALEGAAQLEYESGGSGAAPLLEHILQLRPNDPTSHAMLAAIAYRKHDCQESVRHFEQSGPLLDSQVGALEEYGACLLRLKQTTKAIAAFQRALDSHPDSQELRYQLASVQMRAGDATAAIATITPLLQSGEADDRTLELAASAYEANGDTPQSVATLRQAIVKNPRNTDLYLDFADLCIQHQSFQTGVDMVNTGLRLQSKAAPLYMARGILYVQLAKFDKAEEDFAIADALDPRHSFGAAALGLQAVQQHDPDQALATVQAKLAKKPNDPLLLYLQADVLSQKGPDPDSKEFHTAMQSASKAVSLQPTLVAARDLLARLYLQAGKNDEAVQQCRKALEIDPKDQAAVYHLIQALRKTGKKDELPALLKKLADLRQQATVEERERNRYKLIIDKSAAGDHGR